MLVCYVIVSLFIKCIHSYAMSNVLCNKLLFFTFWFGYYVYLPTCIHHTVHKEADTMEVKGLQAAYINYTILYKITGRASVSLMIG